MIYRPVSKPSFKIEENALVKAPKPKRKVSVYLFRIKTKGHDAEFLKIGIRNNVEKNSSLTWSNIGFTSSGSLAA